MSLLYIIISDIYKSRLNVSIIIIFVELGFKQPKSNDGLSLITLFNLANTEIDKIQQIKNNNNVHYFTNFKKFFFAYT